MKKPEGDGVILLYVTSVMLALSWIVLIARLGVRRWINASGSDDWLMAGGLVRAIRVMPQKRVQTNKKKLTTDTVLRYSLACHCVLLLRCWAVCKVH